MKTAIELLKECQDRFGHVWGPQPSRFEPMSAELDNAIETVLETNGWIDVNDELPPDRPPTADCKVLILVDNLPEPGDMGFYVHERSEWVWSDLEDVAPQAEVVYWQSLPSGPKKCPTSHSA